MSLLRILFIFQFVLFLLASARAHLNDSYNNPYAYRILRVDKPLPSQLRDNHTIYEVKCDFDLQHDTISIPSDCILKFSGGRIINGTILFNKTIIESQYKDIFDNIHVSGGIANREVWLSWWKLAYDSKQNDAVLINQIIKTIDNCIFYYDIRNHVYVGSEKKDGSAEETIAFIGKKNLVVIQPTEYYTILRGRSTTGSVLRLKDNKYISVNGMKVDGANVYFSKYGENGIGVVGNEKALIENCIIENCFSNCFIKEANGVLLETGYPEWGSGGKGIQIEGGSISTQTTIRNNSIKSCYIGLSNNASHMENITMDGNSIDSCYMSIVLMRLNHKIRMNVNIDNTIISNNTGDVGAICMGDASNVCISNTQVKGNKPIRSILRGCFSYSNIQLTVSQPCMCLIDAALYRDNPEGKDAICNYVKIISDQICENIINTSDVIPKKNGSIYANYVGGEFEITLPDWVKSTPFVMPLFNRSTLFNVRCKDRVINGNMETINRSYK